MLTKEIYYANIKTTPKFILLKFTHNTQHKPNNFCNQLLTS